MPKNLNKLAKQLHENPQPFEGPRPIQINALFETTQKVKYFNGNNSGQGIPVILLHILYCNISIRTIGT